MTISSYANMCELSKHTFSLYLHSTTWYWSACWAQQQVRRRFTTYLYFRPTHTAITELIPKECSKCCASIFGRYIMWLLMAYTHCSYTKQSIRVCVVCCVYKCDLVPTYGTANRIEHRLLLPNKLYIYMYRSSESWSVGQWFQNLYWARERSFAAHHLMVSQHPHDDHTPKDDAPPDRFLPWQTVMVIMMMINSIQSYICFLCTRGNITYVALHKNDVWTLLFIRLMLPLFDTLIVYIRRC